MDMARLEAADADGEDPVLAIKYDRAPPGGSLATPHAFVCADGKTYWVKRNAQEGLVAELIAGRLGRLVDAAPMAHIVEVPDLIARPVAPALAGVGVGIEDRPAMEN